MYKVRDRYFKKAKEENYPARSVYKLSEIDAKHRLLKKGARVLDLGCAPGSWLRYCAGKAGDGGTLVGVDNKPLKFTGGPRFFFIQGDVLRIGAKRIKEACPVFDLILSDLAPATSGIKTLDQERSLQLVERSWQLAEQLLTAGGDYLVKIFQGEGVKGFTERLKPRFKTVKTLKPKTSNRSRLEIYLLARGFVPPG